MKTFGILHLCFSFHIKIKNKLKSNVKNQKNTKSVGI